MNLLIEELSTIQHTFEQLITNVSIVREALSLSCENMNVIEAVRFLSTISMANFIVNLFVFGDITMF